MTDRELLQQFVRGASQSAFAQIVRRYGDLVYRCARRQTRDSAMAEDVTQAVFVLLARRAASLGRGVVLAGWLIKVARYAAKDAMAAQVRRRHRERKAADMQRDPVEDAATIAAFAELRPLLDTALARLSERDRGLVAMRYLEGMALVEVARIVGTSPDSVRKRIDRAVVRLRGFLAQRGWEPSGAELPAVLENGAKESAAPEALMAALPALALATKGGAAGAIAQGADRMMRWAKVKSVAVIAAGALVTAAAGGTIAARRAATQPPEVTSPGAVSSSSFQFTAPTSGPAVALSRQVGSLKLKFDEPSPYSALEEMGRRNATASWGTYGRTGRAYDVAQESFQVYVPQLYKPERAPFGLFVWISAGDATMPDAWRGVFDRNRMIYISADNTGNGRDMIPRMGLQLDAVHNMAQRFHIDPDRIYIGGFSGGALTACVAMRGYPDVFSGAFLMSGGEFYLFGEDDDGNVYPSVTWIGTDLPINQAKDLFRIVLLHGSKDYYAIGMKADYESFMLDDFAHVTHFMIEGMGHQMPGAALFEKGLVALDKGKPKQHTPLTLMFQPATRPTSQPKMTYSDVRRPLPAHDPDKQAARVLASAQSYLNNGWLEGAEIGAKRVLADYAQTTSAPAAQVMLDRVQYITPSAMPHGNLNTPGRQALFSGRCAINRNTFDAARLYFDRVVLLSPRTRASIEAAAWIAWMTEHPEQARPRPSSPAALAVIVFQSGLAYERAALPDAAKAAYQRTVHDYPGTPAAIEAKKKLAGS
jgi:RNA polymerase sigma factor (sigma-70 family)